MTQQGGKRNGSGRKKGFKAFEAEKGREYVINRIKAELEPILTAQIEAAKGLCVLNNKGKVYTKEPDLKTGEYLLNQLIGKATQTIESDTKQRTLLVDF